MQIGNQALSILMTIYNNADSSKEKCYINKTLLRDACHLEQYAFEHNFKKLQSEKFVIVEESKRYLHCIAITDKGKMIINDHLQFQRALLEFSKELKEAYDEIERYSQASSKLYEILEDMSKKHGYDLDFLLKDKIDFNLLREIKNMD